jgi:hypothetical protein
MTIVLLDDDPNRVREMLGCLSAELPSHSVISFDNAPDLIAWIGSHVKEIEIFCLDHDLGPNRMRQEAVFDP